MKAIEPPEFTRMMTISTAHLTSETISLMAEECNMQCSLPPVYAKSDYGFFMYCTKGEDYSELPDDLANCIKFAHKHHCEMICFDTDGPVIKELPNMLER